MDGRNAVVGNSLFVAGFIAASLAVGTTGYVLLPDTQLSGLSVLSALIPCAAALICAAIDILDAVEIRGSEMSPMDVTGTLVRSNIIVCAVVSICIVIFTVLNDGYLWEGLHVLIAYVASIALLGYLHLRQMEFGKDMPTWLWAIATGYCIFTLALIIWGLAEDVAEGDALLVLESLLTLVVYTFVLGAVANGLHCSFGTRRGKAV